jgi:TRAP-type C4-dicarboxylate transport system substrate-binding protein
MKKMIFALVIFLMGSGFSYVSSEAREKAKVVIKMGTLAPKGSFVVDIFEEYRDEMREITNNEVDFKIYAGGIQGDDLDVLRKVRLKQMHGGIFLGPALGRMVPEVRVMEIPFVFRNGDEVRYVRSKLEDTMNKYFDDAGYKVLGWRDLGFIYQFSKVPLTSFDVLSQQKVWVWGDDPLMHASYEAIGISPIPLSVTDVLTSLSTRLIDSAPVTPFAAVALRWHTRFKYMSDLPSANPIAAIVITKDIWNKISPESQKKLMERGRFYCKKLTEASKETNRKSIDVLKKAGITIVHSEDSEEKISEVAKKARESVIGKLYSRELLDRTLALLDEYRKSHPNSKPIKIE